MVQITSYQFHYNESQLINFIKTQWLKNFPQGKYILLDNESDKERVELAKKLGYGVFSYSTGNKFSDETKMYISNNLPFNPKGWISVTDFDEVTMITQEELDYEDSIKTTIIRFEGWNIFNLDKTLATRMPRFDKFCMYNSDKIQSMRYGAGAHECYPVGDIKYSKKVYKLFHYGMFDEEYYINRRKLYNERWSEKNLKEGWGSESRLEESLLREKYRKLKEKAIKIC